MAQEEDAKFQECKKAILELLKKIPVAYDREIRYRLEGQFAHDMVGKALKDLEKSGEIKRLHIPGRKRKGEVTNVFYALPDKKYRDLLPQMSKKFDLSIFISGVSSAMGNYAEILWWNAFHENGWELHPDLQREERLGIKEWKGKKASLDNDIDFVAIKDGIEYGVEIKNGLQYPDDLYNKIIVALDLDLIPFIIARWLNPAQVKALRRKNIPFVVYKSSIYSPEYQELVKKAIEVLDVPIECRDKIDREYFQRKVEARHEWVKRHLKEIRRSLEELKEELQDPEKGEELKRDLKYKRAKKKKECCSEKGEEQEF